MEKKGSILVVDDSPGPRSALQMILEPLYRVQTAADGREALLYFQKEDFDLVTLDLEMDGLSGIEVLREMKRTKEGVPVIVISAHNTLSLVREVISRGAENFLSKPFVIHEVSTLVDRAIGQGKKKIRGAEFPVQLSAR